MESGKERTVCDSFYHRHPKLTETLIMILIMGSMLAICFVAVWNEEREYRKRFRNESVTIEFIDPATNKIVVKDIRIGELEKKPQFLNVSISVKAE